MIPRRTPFQRMRARTMQRWLAELEHFDFGAFCEEQARSDMASCETVLLPVLEMHTLPALPIYEPQKTIPIYFPRRMPRKTRLLKEEAA